MGKKVKGAKVIVGVDGRSESGTTTVIVHDNTARTGPWLDNAGFPLGTT